MLQAGQRTYFRGDVPCHRHGGRAIISLRGGFTILEVLIVLCLITLVFSLLLPLVNLTRQHANAAKCASNLRMIAQGVFFYANDNDQYTLPFKNNTTWYDPFHPNLFISTSDPNVYWGVLPAVAANMPIEIFTCPSNYEKTDASGYPNQYTAYGYNGWGDVYSGMSDDDRMKFYGSTTDTALLKKINDDWSQAMGRKLSWIHWPGRTILAQDSWEAFVDGGNNGDTFASIDPNLRGHLTEYPGHDVEYLRHFYKSNVVFVDGHVELLDKDQQTDERYYTGAWNLARSY